MNNFVGSARKMKYNLHNKVTVITGGAGGIGSAIADEFLSKGAKTVILLDIKEDLLKAVTEKLNTKHGADKAVYKLCDVTNDLEEISKEIFEEYTVDVLVNSAGLLAHEDSKKIIDINVAALIEWSTQFNGHMRKDKGGNGGTIINLASTAGYTINPYVPVYVASKFAVFGFTKSFGHIENYNKSDVRTIAVCPGLTSSDMVVKAIPKIDEDVRGIFEEFLKTRDIQPVESVSTGVCVVFESADSGTAWEITGSKPAVEILHSINRIN